MIWVVYAHEPEVKALKGLVQGSALESRVYWRRWRHTSDRLFLNGGPEPELILNAGFAGRLNPELDIGEVVLVGAILDEPGGARRAASAGLTGLSGAAARFAVDHKVKNVSLVTTGRAIMDEPAREALRAGAGADIVDMEARHLFEQAEEAKVPFVSFKLISDGADSDAWDKIKREMAEWSKRLAARVGGFLLEWCEIQAIRR